MIGSRMTVHIIILSYGFKVTLKVRAYVSVAVARPFSAVLPFSACSVAYRLLSRAIVAVVFLDFASFRGTHLSK